MSKRRRVAALERKPVLTPLALRVLRLWHMAARSRRIGFGGAEGVDPGAVLACIDGCGFGSPDSRATLLRLILEHDARVLEAHRRRKEPADA